jgi:hypothetical protein
MSNDKDLFYQMLERYIDNSLPHLNPLAALMVQPVKNILFNFIDPYVAAFFVGDSERINTKAASAFLKSEVNKKIEDFIKEFESQREGNE